MIWKYICLPSNYHISPQKSIYYIYSLDGNVGNIPFFFCWSSKCRQYSIDTDNQVFKLFLFFVFCVCYFFNFTSTV